jgi:phospholipid/cholesterol/gamma-HCH transport system permease protein
MSFFLHELGAIFIYLRELLLAWINRREKLLPLILQQIVLVAERSMGTILFTGLFVGAILVIQFHMMLAKYDATILIGGLSSSAIIREIGPLIISFLIAGKIGAYTAAELGTMKITEQIDAIRCLGVNPHEYVIIPRFVGIVFGTTILLFFGLFVGICGSVVIAKYFYSINPWQFLSSLPRFVSLWTLFGSFTKAFVFGMIVATVCTYYGSTTSGGARGVGRAVTKSAVYTNLFIVLANSFTSYVLESLHSFLNWMTGGLL